MKVGYELELLAPIGLTRHSVAQAFAQKLQLQMKPCFHRESEFWPGDQSTPFYCLTKGFELSNQDKWHFRFINDMTIRHSLDPAVQESPEWYHLLTDDIRFIDLINIHCHAGDHADQILKPIANLYKTDVHSENGIYSVTGQKSKLICGAHTRMADRNRICEIVTAPITENHQDKLDEIVTLAASLGCVVPREGAFHIHFDGTAFANTATLLRFIRYCHVWSGVLKMLIPPNPYCTRLADYSPEILQYAFNTENEKKSFDQTVIELKSLAPTKYCDFNFTNILTGNPDKFTVEVRVIPMMLDAAALGGASDLYMSFMNFICTTDIEYPMQKLEPTQAHAAQLLELI